MRLKTVVDEDFVNFRMPSMLIGTASCGGKCCIEAGIPLSVCQNDVWRESATVEVADEDLYDRFLLNPLTNAIVFGGLEPLEQQDELLAFIRGLRHGRQCVSPVVIYTGYNRDEVQNFVEAVSKETNIIMKFGRYIPNRPSVCNPVLGVTLASDNQYGTIVSTNNTEVLYELEHS